jgi:hypothetical protein
VETKDSDPLPINFIEETSETDRDMMTYSDTSLFNDVLDQQE